MAEAFQCEGASHGRLQLGGPDLRGVRCVCGGDHWTGGRAGQHEGVVQGVSEGWGSMAWSPWHGLQLVAESVTVPACLPGQHCAEILEVLVAQ